MTQDETRKAQAREMADVLADLFAGKPIPCVVNGEAGSAVFMSQESKLAYATGLIEKQLQLGEQHGREAERGECATIAGGWTGEINTVENCSVVSEVCRQVARSIRERGRVR